MDRLVDLIIDISFEDILDYNFPKNVKFGLNVNFDNVKYEFLINLKNSSKIIVLSSSALAIDNKHDRSRPLFHRHSWNFEDSTIFFNDPTLYLNDEILSPWGVGTKENWYLENIAKIIEAIAKNIKIENKNILFYGSSAGGFTSLLLSILIKDSYSLAEVPQLDLRTHWEYHYSILLKHCFNGLPKDYVEEKFKHRLCFLDLVEKEGYMPNAFLLLDCSVDEDFNMQYVNFFNSLNSIEFSTKKMHLIVDWKNKGHCAQGYDETIKLLNMVKYVMDHPLSIVNTNG